MKTLALIAAAIILSISLTACGSCPLKKKSASCCSTGGSSVGR